MTPLATRQLGRTGYRHQRRRTGSWAMGAPVEVQLGRAGRRNLGACVRTRSAGRELDRTAAVYGRGHPKIVGRRDRGDARRAAAVHFTKCGLRWSDSDVFGDPVRCLRPDSMARMRRLLRRLASTRSTSTVPLADSTGVQVEDSWEEMGRLIEQGKVGPAPSPTSTWTCSSAAEDPPRRLAAARRSP